MVGLVVVRKQDLEVFSCRWKSGLKSMVLRRAATICAASRNQNDLARRYGSRQSVWGGGDGLRAVWWWSELSALAVAARPVISQQRRC